MTIFKEDTVRQLYFRQGITELHLKADDYITEQARAYLHEKGIPLHRESPLTSPAPYTPNPDIHPPEGTGASPASFVGPDGEHYSSKPEHMTHLYGNCLVPKNHPRIILRGKLDSLEAAILWAQATAQREGYKKLALALEETLSFCRQILSCEVTGKPLPSIRLFGLTQEELREMSQKPSAYFGIGHLLPSCQWEETGIQLNLLRTQAREAELAAVDAFAGPQSVSRPDILQALNRLSSAYYLLMLRLAAGKEDKESEHHR